MQNSILVLDIYLFYVFHTHAFIIFVFYYIPTSALTSVAKTI
jgi:hypothetical protein